MSVISLDGVSRQRLRQDSPGDQAESLTRGGPRQRGRCRFRAPLGEPKDFFFSIELPLEAVRDGVGQRRRADVILRRHGRRSAPVTLVLGGVRDGRIIAGDKGWWSTLVRSGGAIDLNTLNVLGAEVCGVSPTKPLPAAAEAALIWRALQQCRIPALEALVGAGPGASVALHLAALMGHDVKRLCLACPAEAEHDPDALETLPWRAIGAGATVIASESNRAQAQIELRAVTQNLPSLNAFHAVPAITGPGAYIYEAHLMEDAIAAFMRA